MKSYNPKGLKSIAKSVKGIRALHERIISCYVWYLLVYKLTTADMLLLLLSHTAILLRVVAQHNLTPFGTATQSSTYKGGIPQNAIEPPVSNVFSYGNCSHTTDNTRTPAWWMFQLSIGIAYITDITIYYRERCCQKGYWGSNCEKVCSEYCTERHCYPGNGSCIFGCNTDYCLNDNCNKFTGICTDGCKERRTGDFCNKLSINTAESDDDEVTTRIGIVIGGVLLGILITVVVCFIIKKNRQLPKEQSKYNVSKKTQSHDQHHYDDVGMENVSSYQDLRKDTGANEYDQIYETYANQ